jgi:ketosteroid isomerase-like protein
MKTEEKLMALRIMTLALAMLAFGLTPAVAGDSTSAVLAPIAGAIARANADDAAGVGSYFTPNAVVVDNFAPFVWSGQNAGSAWWTAVDADNAKGHVKNLHATMVKVVRTVVAGNRAYVVVQLTIALVQNGKPARYPGLWTIALAQTGSQWKIANATFSDLAKM